jgi:REP element-mobilizing transposase RayT
MPRANRHYIPGQVWHITHRCHKKEFLLGFRRDRQRWQHWLFEAKKRYGLRVLNYMVTSNHIHLLAVDGGDRDVLPRSLQLVASRTGQEYNQRKERKGAFWEDRYHATAIEDGEHFIRCMTYVDLNMVRAGIVDHPSEWPDCGYHEIQNPRQRYAIIDRQKLAELALLGELNSLKENHTGWLHEMLPAQGKGREDKWSTSIAVGGDKFVSKIKQVLGGKAAGRKVLSENGTSELREPHSSYNADFMPESASLRGENMHYWEIYPDNTDG